MGIRASPVFAAGFPHNSDMGALRLCSEFQPHAQKWRCPVYNYSRTAPGPPRLLVTRISTGASNVSSPYLLRAASLYEAYNSYHDYISGLRLAALFP
jgi:hypothetical protein